MPSGLLPIRKAQMNGSIDILVPTTWKSPNAKF